MACYVRQTPTLIRLDPRCDMGYRSGTMSRDIIEKDRRTPEQRAAADPVANPKGLTKSKSLRFAMERMQRAWDQGFACAVDMLARLHADEVPVPEILENLRGRVRHPQAVPVLARGTRSMEPRERPGTEEDTVPITVGSGDSHEPRE